jgi:hypothetical protein
MRQLALLAGVAALTFTPASAAPPASLSPAVQQDVRCFMLFAAAVDQAQKAKNEKVQEATSLAVMYYYGKLAAEAPSLDVGEAVRQEAKALDGNQDAKQVGATCDAEFAKRGQELMQLGAKLQQPPAG